MKKTRRRKKKQASRARKPKQFSKLVQESFKVRPAWAFDCTMRQWAKEGPEIHARAAKGLPTLHLVEREGDAK